MPEPTPTEAEVIAAMTDDERRLYEFSMGMRAAAGDIARRQIEAAKPARIQLSRAKGWRLPPNTVVVARPAIWGNPFKVADARDASLRGTDADLQARCVDSFRRWLSGSDRDWMGAESDARRRLILARLPELRGKTLACWCKPGTPCHADVLLELANA